MVVVFISTVVKVFIVPVAVVITMPMIEMIIPVVLISLVVLIIVIWMTLVVIVMLILAVEVVVVTVILFIKIVATPKSVSWLCMMHMMLIMDWLFMVDMWLSMVFFNLVLIHMKINVVVIKSWVTDTVSSNPGTWGQLIILYDLLFNLWFLHFELKESIFDSNLRFKESGAISIECHVVGF